MSETSIEDINEHDVLNDITKVSRDVESELKPSSYEFLGRYSIENIIELFGSWESALDQAGVSEKETILDDLRRVSNICGDNFSFEDYKKHGDYSSSYVQKVFGSWNKAKEKAGLETNDAWINKAISDYELNKDLKRVASCIYGPLLRDEYDELGKYSEGTVVRRFDGWSNAIEQLELNDRGGTFEDKMGLEQNRLHRDYLKNIAEELEAINVNKDDIHTALKFHGSLKKSQAGRRVRNTNEALLVCLFQALRDRSIGVRYKELMKQGDFATSGDFFGIMRTLKEHEDIEYNLVKASEFIDRYEKIMELNTDIIRLSKAIAENSDTSNSPSITAASSIYISDQELSADNNQFTQAEISKVFNISEVGLRNAKKSIRQNVNVEEIIESTRL